MTTPNCPKCARSMKLLDSETQRYYCYRDDIVYLGSKNSWIGLIEEPRQVSTPSVTPTKQKSILVGLVVNLLVTGAGLMYAGNWAFGILYLVATIILVFFVWPLGLIVALASYAHTVFAVQAYNSRMAQGSPDTGPRPPLRPPAYELPPPATGTLSSSAPPPPNPLPPPQAKAPIPGAQPGIPLVGAAKFCANCGASLPVNAAFCRECGHAQRPQGQSVDIPRQAVEPRSPMVYTKTSPPGSCKYCGAKMSDIGKVCRVCGFLKP